MRRLLLAVALVLTAVVAAWVLVQPVDTAAYAIIRPWKRPMLTARPPGARDVTVAVDGERIQGWLMEPEKPTRPLVVYLHGIADNRASGLWIAERLLALGHPVLVYDSRAHGLSDGPFCTFGVREAVDLRRLLDAVAAPRAILLGVSLGGAVALQAAADDPRVRAVVAVSTFADLHGIVQERAPRPLRGGFADRAVRRAGEIAGFDPDLASPLRAAARIAVPVLLVHGADDRDTSPVHSQRLRAALRGDAHHLLLVPGAGHGDALSGPGAWEAVVSWLSRIQ
jgi:pimeloyl-ACP methyl ester carboxylesterase